MSDGWWKRKIKLHTYGGKKKDDQEDDKNRLLRLIQVFSYLSMKARRRKRIQELMRYTELNAG
jgi:hypothetical protein